MKDPIKLFGQYIKKNEQIVSKDKEANQLLQAISNGSKTYARVTRTEDTARDISWVAKISDAIPHIMNIVDNPKSFIKSVNYLVPAELAKRTGPESIIHLATHSQYVKSIDKKTGDIIPSKILTSESETDVQIYENRFVMTLIKRLYLYIEKRYAYLKHFADLEDTDILYLKSDFDFSGLKIKADTTITMARPAASNDAIRAELDRSLKSVEEARKYIAYFMTSNFIKVDMKGARHIVPPVMQTNTLKKNTDYKAAYRLWMFLNEQEKASMNFLVNENIKMLTEEERKRIDFINYLCTLDVLASKNLKTMRYTKNIYKTKNLKSIDDLLYLNDKFKPFELVRADEKYYDDLSTPIVNKIAKVSKKVQKTVFKKDLAELKRIAKEKQAAQKLVRRKKAEANVLAREEAKRTEAERKAAEQKAKEEAAAAEQRKIKEIEDLRLQIKRSAEEDKNKFALKASEKLAEQKKAEEQKKAKTEIKPKEPMSEEQQTHISDNHDKTVSAEQKKAHKNNKAKINKNDGDEKL